MIADVKLNPAKISLNNLKFKAQRKTNMKTTRPNILFAIADDAAHFSESTRGREHTGSVLAFNISRTSLSLYSGHLRRMRFAEVADYERV